MFAFANGFDKDVHSVKKNCIHEKLLVAKVLCRLMSLRIIQLSVPVWALPAVAVGSESSPASSSVHGPTAEPSLWFEAHPSNYQPLPPTVGTMTSLWCHHIQQTTVVQCTEMYPVSKFLGKKSCPGCSWLVCCAFAFLPRSLHCIYITPIEAHRNSAYVTLSGKKVPFGANIDLPLCACIAKKTRWFWQMYFMTQMKTTFNLVHISHTKFS